MQGVIQTHLPDKKYGFIKGDDGKSYFFHESKFRNKSQIKKICDDAVVKFERYATPKGYQAISCELINTSDVLTYIKPEKFISSKSSKVKGWELVEEGEWVVKESSSDSPDAAKKEIIKRAQKLGANALINVEYSKTVASDGNYFFSIHNYQGRIATIAKRSAMGKITLDDLWGLNERAALLKQELIKETKRRQKRIAIFNLIIWFLTILFSLFLALIGMGGYSLVPIVILILINYYSSHESCDLWLEKRVKNKK